MGCGTGRLLLPIARAGVAITGVDLSPEMLERCRASLAKEPAEVQGRVSLQVGDVRSVALPSRFAAITAPFRIVQHLVTREDQRLWLRTVARHLAPGGTLTFDVFQPNYRFLVEPREEVELDYIADGARIQRIVRVTPHPELQLLDLHFRWESGGKVIDEAASTFRWFTKAELENLLELEGFTITHYFGSFAREPFGEGSPDQIVEAVRR
jgi:SAM-dependent methyltransferase